MLFSKKKFYGILLFILLFNAYEIRSNEPLPTKINPTFICVSPEQIFFENTNIFVELEGETFLVKSLHSDSDGFYITEAFYPLPYICARCGHVNPSFNFVCEVCKNPREERPWPKD